jgi:predicted RecA/RadA family phage recombinase
MATNGVQPGKILTITAGGAVTSGSVQEVGAQIIGVALSAASGSGVEYELQTEGVFTIGKKTGETWAVGDKLYWDASASTASKTYVASAADNFIGTATSVAASAATTGNVKLRGGAKAQGEQATTTEAETDALIGAGTIGADRLADDQLTGQQVAVIADDASIGGIPVLFVVDVPAAAGDTDIPITEAIEVLSVQCIKTDEAGVAGGTLTVKNGNNAITDAITWDNTTADKTFTAPSTLDDAYSTIAAAGTLRVTTSQAQSRGLVVVTARKV